MKRFVFQLRLRSTSSTFFFVNMHWGFAYVVVGLWHQPVHGSALFKLQKFKSR